MRGSRGAFAAVLIAVAFAATGCTSRRVRPEGTAEPVPAYEIWLPEDAAAGMFVTWTHRKGDESPDDVRTETHACVAETPSTITMERRETTVGGAASVLAIRYDRSGRPLGAWRGPSGGVGVAAPIETERTNWEEVGKRTDEMRRSIGAPAPTVSTKDSIEVVATPAGPIRCRRQTTRVTLLFVSATASAWQSVERLPLTWLVKTEMDGIGPRQETLLSAYGRRGAVPTLTIPPE